MAITGSASRSALAVTATFTTRGAVAAHVAHPIGQVGRDALEVVARQHDAGARLGRPLLQRRGGLPLEVDVVGAQRERPRQDRQALGLAALEAAAFPGRPAGGDHRPAAAGQGRVGVGPIQQVEAQLHQVGP